MKKQRHFQKTLLYLMKISLIQVFIAVIFAGVSLAHGLSAQDLLNKKVTLRIDNKDIKSILRNIENAADVKFTYRPKLISIDQRISINANNEKLSEVLEKLLKPLNISWEIIGDQIILKKNFSENSSLIGPVSTQTLLELAVAEQSVSGTITDEKGESLPGVNVLIKGTQRGTTSDSKGQFKITVADSKAVLIFSSIGYAKQEIIVGNRNNLNVTMISDDKTLNEVVVVGYGNQERRDVTGAVATVNNKNIKDLPLTSADQKLAGQVAGVQVNQVTGAPGGGVVVRVRGSGSIGAGDDPLYVIDGFPVTNSYDRNSNPLSTLNPDDIESMTVLKDASSTAIYGSRGSNGVILITTKKAKTGASNIEFNFYTGIQTIPDRSKIKMMTAQEFAQFRIESRQDAAKFANKPFDPATIPADYQNPASLGAGTNWFEQMTQTAPIQSYNLTVSKGSENLRSLISIGYFNQQGTVKNTSFERFSARINIEGNPRKNITIGANLNPSYVNRKIADTEGHFNTAILTQGLLNSPLPPAFQADGSYTPSITSSDMFVNANPLSVLMNSKNVQTSMRLLGNTYIDFTLAKGLHFKSTFNVDWTGTKGDLFTPSYVGSFRNPPPQLATGSTGSTTLFNWLNENTLTYDKSWNNHHLNVLAGYTIQRERYENTTTRGSQYPDDVVQTINAATILTASADVREWRLISFLGRVNYSFKDKYLLSAAVRRDGSSRFGPNNRFAYFPSTSVGWRISDEDFFPKTEWLSDLKLRASYGLAGNNAIGDYTFIPGITADNYVFGGALSNGFKLNSLANANLGWESSRQLDAGFDASLLKGRLNLTAEYYQRHTESMLQTIDIPTASGFSTAITNIGNVLNSGFEFSANSKNTVGKFKWETDFNISFNRNKVLDLGNKVQIISGSESTNITVVGAPMGQFYGYIFQGIFQTQADLDASPKQAGQVLGSVKYKDVNGDGKIDANDKTAMGNPNPDFIWGMTNRFSYRNFDLSILINGSQGAKILDLYKRFTTNIDGVFNVEAEVKDRWRSPENPGNGRIPTTVANTALSREINSLWVNDASYVAVRNITLGYNMKTKWASGLRIYVSAQNALLFTSYKGGWPEVNYNGNSSLAPGVNYTGYPVPVSYNIGANIKF